MVIRVRVKIRGRARRDDFVTSFASARDLIGQARKVDPKARISVALFDLVGTISLRELFKVRERARGRVPIPRLVVAEGGKLYDHHREAVNARLAKRA